MKLFKKLISVLLMLAMITSSSILVRAAEQTVVTTLEEDTPSNWALWNVQMASVYGLGSAENYKNYKSGINGSQLLYVQSSFETKFSVLDETKIDEEKAITRGDVVNELYDIIEAALELDVSTEDNTAINYFVDKQLIYGSNGDYALESMCTQQEMLTFSQRVYEYLTYELNLDAKGAFWEVSDEDNTVYLLGSVHATDGSVYPMSKDIMRAFINSAAVAVEANILVTNAEDTAYMQQIMMLEGDKTLDQLIVKEKYEVYAAMMQSVGFPAEVYNKLKPWAAAMMVQTLQMANTSYSASMGIDLYFLTLANGWKPIIELEGIKFQVDMFDSFSPELQKIYY